MGLRKKYRKGSRNRTIRRGLTPEATVREETCDGLISRERTTGIVVRKREVMTQKIKQLSPSTSGCSQRGKKKESSVKGTKTKAPKE